MNKLTMGLAILALGAFSMTMGAGQVRADGTDATVDINTSSLAGSSSGPFELAFFLQQGGTATTNTVTLSDFAFGGGSGSLDTVNFPPTGTSGTLGTGLTISETLDSLNGFALDLTPGSAVTFLLSTTEVDNGDYLSCFLLDNTGTPITTTDGVADSLFTIVFDGTTPTIEIFSSDLTGTPTITENTVTPEPSGLLLLGTGVLAMAGLMRRKVLSV